MMYFRYLFRNMEELTPIEGLVYSELLFNSLVSNEHYRTGKLLYIDAAKDRIKEVVSMGWNEEIDYYPMDTSRLMKNTELSFNTVKKTVAILKDKGYIDQYSIKCPKDLLNAGYIKIPHNTKLKGRQLIFYAFLLDRASQYNGTIDTWAYKFKDLCGIENSNVYFLINKLKAHNLVRREDNGKLTVLKPESPERKTNKKRKALTASPK